MVRELFLQRKPGPATGEGEGRWHTVPVPFACLELRGIKKPVGKLASQISGFGPMFTVVWILVVASRW